VLKNNHLITVKIKKGLFDLVVARVQRDLKLGFNPSMLSKSKSLASYSSTTY
jgi:hypothetical protein